MKKLIIVYVVLIVAVILLAIFKVGGNFSIPFLQKSEAVINGTKINLIVARSEKDKIKGLSERKSLPSGEGMLFIFNKPDRYPFWMKGMLFPIDIIYLANNSVVYIVENAPAPGQAPNLTIYKPDQPANYVLELNSGMVGKLGIKKGTKITFKNI